MAWTFVLTDSSYNHLGEILNAGDRRVAKPISNLDTASFAVRLDNPLAGPLMDAEGYIKAYRNNGLEFFGPIISAEESVSKDNATVAVNAVSSGWILSKRLAGKSSTGTAFGATDRAQIGKTLIDTTNAENETGIATDLDPIYAASSVTYAAGPFKFISDCVKELATAADGFDWRVLPIDNFSNGTVASQKIGSFTAAPVLGQNRPDAAYEYGTGRSNIAAYTRNVDRSTQANKVYHFTSAGPDAPGYPTVSAIDGASISNYKLLEDLANADLLDLTLRQQFVSEHVAVRRFPKQVINFQPHIDPGSKGRLPAYKTEFDVGDFVIARAMYGGVWHFNGVFRVWGIEFALDPAGMETQTLTLVQEN